jgi:hypothetical protein
MAAGEEVSDLPGFNRICNHTFHLQCAALWLKTKVEARQKGCCPVCNAEIIQPVLIPRTQPHLVIRATPPRCALWIMFILLIAGVIVIALLYTGDIGEQ